MFDADSAHFRLMAALMPMANISGVAVGNYETGFKKKERGREREREVAHEGFGRFEAKCMQKANWSIGYSGIWLDDHQDLFVCTLYQYG